MTSMILSNRLDEEAGQEDYVYDSKYEGDIPKIKSIPSHLVESEPSIYFRSNELLREFYLHYNTLQNPAVTQTFLRPALYLAILAQRIFFAQGKQC